MNKKYLLIILILATFFACKNSSENSNAENTNSSTEFESPDLPADFMNFYQRFHSDSLFQIEHITFPLEGLPDNISDGDDPALLNFRWQKADWKMQRLFDMSIYKREFSRFGKHVITEYIWQEPSNYGIMRRFSQSGDSYYLIYYAGMNKMQSE